MQRRAFLKRSTVGFSAALGAANPGSVRSANGAPADRPNIIFILTDDQRWDTLGCMGNAIIKTPVLDRLAAEGTRFTNAFVTSPACTPNRACLFTGLQERTHGYTFGSPPMKRAYSDLSYPRLLKKSGYRTGYVGKKDVQFEPGVNEELFDSLVPLVRTPYIRKVNGQDRHLTEIMVDKSIEFLDSCRNDQPFCLSLSFHAPHAEDNDPQQYYWPKSCDGLYDDVTIPLPQNAYLFDTMPGYLQTSFNRMRWWQRFCTPEKYQQMVKGYYRMITGIDREVGRLRAVLQERGLASNTVIIFMGDNGYFLGERGFGCKFMLYEQALRVPLIIYDARLPAPQRGTVCDRTVLNLDIAPTILDLAGIEAPPLMHGRSLKPLAEGKTPEWRNGFLGEYLSTAFPSIVRNEGYRAGRWKYIRWIDFGPEAEELYDLANDPLEEHNLAKDGSRAAQLREIRKECNIAIARYESDRY
ncbi:MAG: sulfatase family protein [Candidatus Latescibacterota bacterium]